jgi:Fasciclin domain
MRRLLPLTAMYAPNADWEGKIIALGDISKTVLESHLFDTLLWCDTLRAKAGTRVASLNGQTWLLSINEEGFPCFDTLQVFGGPSFKACITKCDILARNGIVHELDSLLLFQNPETLAPQDPTAPSVSVVRDPASPTLSRPTQIGGAEPGVPGSFGSVPSSPAADPTPNGSSGTMPRSATMVLALSLLLAARV